MAVVNSFSLLLPSSSSSSLSHKPSPILFSSARFNARTTVPLFCSLSTNVAVSGGDFLADYGDWIPERDPKDRRRAGVLLHPTSFHGPYGIGDLGDEAFRFIDWLHDSGCSLWQVLPLVPPGRKANEEGSPYSGQDANCGNTLLISLEELVKDGLLAKDELPQPIDVERVNFCVVADLKDPLIIKAAERLIQSNGELKSQFEDFCRDPNILSWLEDAAYFAAIDDALNTFSWYFWPEPLKNRHLAALEDIYQSKKDFIVLFMAQQFLFQRQWQKVRNYAQMKGISIMGDMPIYVGYHSADVWANKKYFLLNRNGFPLLVSGVPPDAFSETGQLWDSIFTSLLINFIFDLKALSMIGKPWRKRGFLGGFAAYNGHRIYLMNSGLTTLEDLLAFGPFHLKQKLPRLDGGRLGSVGNINIIAEDLILYGVHWGAYLKNLVHVSIDLLLLLCSHPSIVTRQGVITEDVVQLRKSIGAPGMAVLQFGFGSDAENPHLPHNHECNQVVYTGTHDNDTIRGWWDSLKHEEKSNVLKYLSITEENDIPWALIQAALSSVAQTAIIPMQDILGLGSSARMNIPATQFGNWSWRIPSSIHFDDLETQATKLRDMLSMYGRL
ncbi:hypothetical protein EZV62_015132 [Acer yangbiense]|uniref:4-alpha-glucanotransferase n=1 Tax=Acer yangbiense TaxID=1000413 RepID=A0A5C7HUU3_9ROSI|nr:hypothetical protein EZV62_015132 [Acer yangbiense]